MKGAGILARGVRFQIPLSLLVCSLERGRVYLRGVREPCLNEVWTYVNVHVRVDFEGC